MAIFGLLIVLLVALAVPAIIQYNPAITGFNYYFGAIEAPLSYELLAAFAVGFLACLLIVLPMYLRAGLKARRLQKANKKNAAGVGAAGG
ncbi:MAG: LapA family protein [Gammaproteobacteria bacterium]|nr:LapA family protein [Gammaproteobacteria bacterium]